jgi:hypothetical protein
MSNLRIKFSVGFLTILLVVACAKPTCETSGQYFQGFINGVVSNFNGNLLIRDKRELVVKILNMQTINEDGGVLECKVRFSWNLKRDNQEFHVKDSDMVFWIVKDLRGELTAVPRFLMGTSKEDTEKSLEFISFQTELITLDL